MDFIDGKTLNNFLNEKVTIDVKNFLANFIGEVGKTLKKIEEMKLTHNDLHSENILVVEDELEKGKILYPPQSQLFNAFEQTPCALVELSK